MSSLQARLRTAAAANATIAARFGSNPLRWFDVNLPENQLGQTCARVQKISTIFETAMNGRNAHERPLVQIDVIDRDPETARTAMREVLDFLATVNMAGGNPAIQNPVVVLNQRSGYEPGPHPGVYVESVDVRFSNVEV